MADIIEFPKDDTPISVTLSGREWFLIMLALAGRGHDVLAREAAEAKVLKQLGEAR